MSKLNELIRELCSDGVEYRPLGKVAVCQKTKNKTHITEIAYSITQKGLIPTSDYFGEKTKITSSDTSGYYLVYKDWFVYSPSRIDIGSINYLRADGPVIVSPLDVVFSVDTTAISPSFLLIYLTSHAGMFQILNHRQGIEGTGRKTLPFSEFAKIKIPVPPLPVQREIVRILDNFTELTTKLTAELAARQKQYEYYRDKLLSFSAPSRTDDHIWRTIEEICKSITSGGTPKSKNITYYGGTIPWLRTQEVDWIDIYDTEIKITAEGLSNSSAKWIPKNCVIVAMYGATAAKVAINKISLTTNQACCNLEIDENKALYRYVFYWLSKEYLTLKSLGQGSQSNINAQIIRQYPIPIPPLAVQSRIVSILGRFDAICHDISSGLPAEIEARRKQYEYYRDKLLTFDKRALTQNESIR